MTASETDQILDAVGKFCRARLTPDDVRRRDETHTPPYDLLPVLGELGSPRIPFAETDGGLGLGWTVLCRVLEHIAGFAYAPASIMNRVISFSAMPVMMFGTPRQKAELLPRFLAAETFAALALTEPDVGSDARAVKTRARRTGSGWTLTGRKTWISDADRASYLLTLCRTPDDGERSLTAFLVPRKTPGLHMTELKKIGHNCMPSFDIGFDEVSVPDESRLGAVGAGFNTVTGTLGYSRACMAATVTGCAQAAADMAARYARDRVQFGRPIAAFQVIKHRLVDMQLEVRKAQLLMLDLAQALDGGTVTPDQPAMAKIAATEALQFVANHGMQIMASAGYAAESDMQRIWRDARLYTFGEGTNEIQREIIAKALGLG
jgi:alkylation response protein AidB-like acyl-CoA dehydrogenase